MELSFILIIPFILPSLVERALSSESPLYIRDSIQYSEGVLYIYLVCGIFNPFPTEE